MIGGRSGASGRVAPQAFQVFQEGRHWQNTMLSLSKTLPVVLTVICLRIGMP
jgi:PII-like signaling protein